jgi:uncharacterized protein involved in cysteine biosynthesis
MLMRIAAWFRAGSLLLRRGVAGAWQVPSAFVFLVRRPGIWPAALMPAAMAAAGMGLGSLLGWLAGPALESVFSARSGATEWSGLALSLGVRVAAILAGVLCGFGVALLLAAPLLDRLSRQVEAAASGRIVDRSTGLGWEVAQSVRGAGYFLLRMPGILLLGLVPFVGPPLSALWAAHALAFQNTDPTLGRHGLDFVARRAWHRENRALSLGLGFAGLLCLLVPCAGFLMAPALVTAGTRLVLDRGTARRG